MGFTDTAILSPSPGRPAAPTVSRALRGEPCTISTARKLCDLFGAKFSDFFELKKEVRIHE